MGSIVSDQLRTTNIFSDHHCFQERLSVLAAPRMVRSTFHFARLRSAGGVYLSGLRRSYRCLSFLIALRPFCRLAVRNVLQPLPCVSASCSLRGREPDLPCSKSCASVFRRRHSSFSPNWTHDKEYSSIQGRISTFPVSISYIAPITARPSSSSFRITRLLSMRSILLFTFRQQAL